MRPVNDYFGKPWNAPAVEGARRVRRPLGRRCGYCRFRITPWARGFILPAGDGACSKDWQPLGVPWHRECLFSTVAGHAHGLCGCTFPARTPRERFRLSVLVWNNTSPEDLHTRMPLSQRRTSEISWLLPPGLLVLDVPFTVPHWQWRPGIVALCGLAATLGLVNLVYGRRLLPVKSRRVLALTSLFTIVTIICAIGVIASLYVKDFHG